MNNIKKIWLDQESISGKNVVRKRVESVSGLNCYVGLIGVTGARMFQMELDSKVSVNRNFLRKFRGVDIQVIRLSDIHNEYTIILLEKNLNDIFTMFIEDIVEKLNGVKDSQQAIFLINQRVNYWKRLFARATGELLSAERQRGLFGELCFLELLLQNSTKYNETILSWRGVESANQDFILKRNAVEIKTTKSNKSSIHISNELQLDFTKLDHLFLGLISVTETTGIHNSIMDIIERIKNLINHDIDLIREFETRLELAGIGVDMIESYDEISYSIRNWRFFRVQDGFPLILKDTLPSEAIYNVKYQIEISSCNLFEVLEEEVLNTIV